MSYAKGSAAVHAGRGSSAGAETAFECLKHINEARIVRGTAEQLAAWDVTVGTNTAVQDPLSPATRRSCV